jgi:hypothetical protein
MKKTPAGVFDQGECMKIGADLMDENHACCRHSREGENPMMLE